MALRKSLAGALIRLAHRVYRPRVNEDQSSIYFDPWPEIAETMADLQRWQLASAQEYLQRRESRGWN